MTDLYTFTKLITYTTIILSIIALGFYFWKFYFGSFNEYIKKKHYNMQRIKIVEEEIIDVNNKVKTRKIREFIYLDVPKLFSLYSQVFEGLSEKIVEEHINQIITGEAQKSLIKQAESDSQTFEAYRRIESGVLHDHMYNRLEKEIESTIIDAYKVNKDEIKGQLSDCPIIKVSGTVEIEDYQRVNIFFDKFNELGEIIAYSAITGNPEIEAKIQILKEGLNSSGKERRKQIEYQINELKDAKKLAEEMGLVQDPIALNNLKFFGELFNPDGYDVLITPANLPDLHYRGILDRTWLRIDPKLMMQLFGGQSESPWSMVGTVTHVQGTFTNLSKPSENIFKQTSQKLDAQENPMMLDAYRNMFRSLRVMERMFLESKIDMEIIVAPIAIYREFKITIS
jgi:hypothetical protein